MNISDKNYNRFLFDVVLSISSSKNVFDNFQRFVDVISSADVFRSAIVYFQVNENSDTKSKIFSHPANIINSSENYSDSITEIQKFDGNDKYRIIEKKNLNKENKFWRLLSGNYVILFELDSVGFLMLSSDDYIPNNLLEEVYKITKALTSAIEIWKQNEKLILKLNDINNIEKNIANLAKFPNENPNPIMRVSNIGELLFANSASKVILKFLDVKTGEVLPNSLKVLVDNVARTGESISTIFECSSCVFELKFIPIPNADYINIYGSDITEEKKVKDELKELKLFYEQTLNDLPGQIAVFDSNLKYLYLNKQSIKDDSLRKWIIGKNDFEYCEYRGLDKNIAEDRQKKLKLVIEKKEPVSFEERLITKEGEEKFFLRFISPVIKGDQTINLLAYGIDITDRKLVESSLNESSARIEAIVNNAVEAIITIDEKGLIDSFNPQAEIIFGYTADEMIGRNVNQLMPFPHSEQHDRYIKKYLETGERKIIGIGREVEGKRKDGKIIPLELSVSEVNINNKKLFTGIIRDITERKEAEERLIESNKQILKYSTELQETICSLEKSENEHARSEEQLSAVLGTVGEGIITINEASDIIMANDEVSKIWGYSKDELLGHKLTKLMPKKFREGHMEGMERYKNSGIARVLGKKIELEGEHKNGSLFPIEITIKKTIIDNKTYFTAAVHDISEKQNLIAQLKRSNDALSEFAYIASHDLREPLRKISSFGSILEESLVNKIDEDDMENLEFMIDGSKRMQQMIDDLLSYSRLTSQILSLKAVDTTEVIDELINFELAELIEETNADISVNERLGTIKGEQTQIKQLFQNIINNALKYRKKDVNPVVKIYSEKVDNFIKIYVEDNGIGISSDYHNQIFEMFKRLHDKSVYSGNGIGLSICKKIIDLHGGEIGVLSKQGEGSTFWFTLINEEDYFGNEF